ncbi:metallophosphoesterase family protein [Yinghuangia aomiensis]
MPTTTRLLLTTDTHIPRRARVLPDVLLEAVSAADVVVHARGLGGRGHARPLHRAGAAACRRVRQQRRARAAGPAARVRRGPTSTRLRLAVVHETGAAAGRERRCAARFPDTDLLVFGHSHIPWDTAAPGGLRLLNPGSPTDRRQSAAAHLHDRRRHRRRADRRAAGRAVADPGVRASATARWSDVVNSCGQRRSCGFGWGGHPRQGARTRTGSTKRPRGVH